MAEPPRVGLGTIALGVGPAGKLVGIVSWGIGCGRYPGFYTRVSTYFT